MSTPVLVIGFNRPDLMTKLLTTLEANNVHELYVSLDGPRPLVESDRVLCEKTWRIVEHFSSHFNLRMLRHSTNLGLAKAVPTAISWFFDQEPCGIILEDDCHPVASFFPFCDQLLDHYSSVPEVMMISGSKLNFEQQIPQDSYSMSRRGHIWGWATWAESWIHYDQQMSGWGRFRKSDEFKDICNNQAAAISYWRWTLDNVEMGRISTWDYQWLYTMWLRGGLSISPPNNLIQNVGFRGDATNTHMAPDWIQKLQVGSVVTPLEINYDLAPDRRSEIWTDNHIYEVGNVYRRVTRVVERVLNFFYLDRPVKRLLDALRHCATQVQEHQDDWSCGDKDRVARH